MPYGRKKGERETLWHEEEKQFLYVIMFAFFVV